MDVIKIDISKIPDVDMENLCADLIEAVKRYYSDPAHKQEYEALLRKEEKEAAEAQRIG